MQPELASILRPFADQAVTIDLIVAVGCQQLGMEGEELVAGRDSATSVKVRSFPASAIAGLGILARQMAADVSSEALLLVPEPLLHGVLVRGRELGFRAVATLVAGSGRHDSLRWRLQRILFDYGLVGLCALELAFGDVRCFLASECLDSARSLGAGSRGKVVMSRLGTLGRFANQLFQYAYVKLYALRHGLTPGFPRWEGAELYGLDDPACAPLPEVRFGAFDESDRVLWKLNNPPIDIDLRGYFQEIPACWARHRTLLRRMFQLPRARRTAIDDWHAQLTGNGHRTLVAIHVRRGDYRDVQVPSFPWFRLVPEDWYLDWLRAIWPSLRDPILFVATDEPDVIRPAFREFEQAEATLPASAASLPDHVREFEVLRCADVLAICNSSFSRMAAILANSRQRCFIPAFDQRKFVRYEPWGDPRFWARFGNALKR